MTSPLFSIVMPLYNHDAYVAEAIESVLSQTLADWELIICDDGSTDQSLRVAMSYKDPRIHTISKPLNQGGPDALNSALFLSRGRYICWLSSDDIYHPEKLASHSRRFEMNPTCTVSIAPHGTMIDGVKTQSQQLVPEPEKRIATFLYVNYINGLSVAIERRELARAGMFSQKFPHCADMHRWMTLFRMTEPLYFDGSPLSYTRLQSSSQPDTPFGTAFEPARMLFNELCKYGVSGFAPKSTQQHTLRPETTPEPQYKAALSALLDSRNFLYRWGLGESTEVVISNEIRGNDRLIARTVATSATSHPNSDIYEALNRVINLASGPSPVSPTSIPHYAVTLAARASDENLRRFFNRYIQSTLQ